MTIAIRIGSPADFEAAVDVWREANTARRSGTRASEVDEGRVRSYGNMPDAFFLVADDGGQIVGMALGMQAKEADGAGNPIPGLCHIAMVFVRSDRWGEGIGTKILQAIMTEAHRTGYHSVQLWTHATNDRARMLYERNGFRRSGRTKADDHGELIVHFQREIDGPTAAQ